MHLARVPVKVARADEVEILIAVQVSVGVDIVDIDVVALNPKPAEILDDVAIDALAAFSRAIEVERVGVAPSYF
jgi:hypothetical protein